MITLTNTAVQELKRLLKRKFAAPDEGLRLGIEKGGCAGMQYTMGIEAARDGDETLKQDGEGCSTSLIMVARSFPD